MQIQNISNNNSKKKTFSQILIDTREQIILFIFYSGEKLTLNTKQHMWIFDMVFFLNQNSKQ